MQRSEDAVNRTSRELTPGVKECGNVRLAESRLPSEQRDAESFAFYPSQQLHTKAFVHLAKVHLWKVRCLSHPLSNSVPNEQTGCAQFCGILRASLLIARNKSRNVHGNVDVKN